MQSLLFRLGFLPWAALAVALGSGGCQLFVDDTDREVYRLIEERQKVALGQARGAAIDSEQVPIKVDPGAYAFVPHPLDQNTAPVFPAATRPAVQTQPYATATAMPASAPEYAPTTEPAPTMLGEMRPRLELPGTTDDQPIDEVTTTEPVISPMLALPTTLPAGQGGPRREITLVDALAYAFQNSREYQFAKEDLYLTALALTLERYLWTPRLFSNIASEYANYGQIRDFDHAMRAVANVGVRQRLPFGGEVTARVVDTLMRDLTHHITSAETGAMILEANLPLLRGAGKVALESRFQAERNLIYGVRIFERFRRGLAVDIAGDYFNLQQLRQAILNSYESLKVFEQEAARARALWRAGRRIQLEVQRAEQNQLAAINDVVDAREAYQTGLDQFKIRIGMPTDEPIDVTLVADLGVAPPTRTDLLAATTLEEALQIPGVSEEAAVEVALKYRLDLLNDFDRIDDAARGVNIAENGLLPDLQATGSVRMDTDPARLGTFNYNSERTTWRGGLNLELPLDRKAERNALRTSLIQKRRAERDYEGARDSVRLQVRRALRRVEQERTSLDIQTRNRDLAIERRRGARYQFDKGLVSNREIVDAENELLAARNRLAQAQSRLRLAILQFLRDTETLRIDDSGAWATTGNAASKTIE